MAPISFSSPSMRAALVEVYRAAATTSNPQTLTRLANTLSMVRTLPTNPFLSGSSRRRLAPLTVEYHRPSTIWYSPGGNPAPRSESVMAMNRCGRSEASARRTYSGITCCMSQISSQKSFLFSRMDSTSPGLHTPPSISPVRSKVLKRWQTEVAPASTALSSSPRVALVCPSDTATPFRTKWRITSSLPGSSGESVMYFNMPVSTY